MKYTITYSLAADHTTTAGSKEEAESKLKDYLRDNGVSLHSANFKVTDIVEEDSN